MPMQPEEEPGKAAEEEAAALGHAGVTLEAVRASDTTGTAASAGLDYGNKSLHITRVPGYSSSMSTLPAPP